MQRVHNLLCMLERLSLPAVTAESCTSGLLASALTSRPKSPTMLLGGIVAYSNPVKQKLLNVDPAILDEQRGPGEVSKECALAMARGALHNVGVLDVEGQGVGISTTGFLNGGPPGREGEVWIGCCWKFKDSTGSRAKQYWVKNGKGSIDGQEHEEAADQRDQEKLWVVDKALDLLTEVVEELESKAKAGKL